MGKYCERNGHARGSGSTKCLDCGADLGQDEIPARGRFDDPDPKYNPAGAVTPVTAEGAVMPETKPTNPKDAIGTKKLPMHLVPSAVSRYASLAFAEGACKYGKFNWRAAGVRISVYLDAIARHQARLTDGEWSDPETQVPHLASIIACCGIILDAQEVGNLTDDRPPINAYVGEMLASSINHYAHIKQLFAAHSPHQHTIED